MFIVYGVEPICKVLPIAPSTYYEQKARQKDPDRRPPRCQCDDVLRDKIWNAWDENYRVYGIRKVWRELGREGVQVARCTVAKLMREMGLQGVVRGHRTKTTIPAADHRPEDRVNRDFQADRPDALWVADLTYVATWPVLCMSHS